LEDRIELECLLCQSDRAVQLPRRLPWRFPVKCNQQRHLVEDLVRFGKPHQFGLEAGSKPELMIALAMLDNPERSLICNGYKDREYIETAMLATRLGADADYCDRAD